VQDGEIWINAESQSIPVKLTPLQSAG